MEDQQSPSFRETVEEIMKIFRSLPPRPTIEEVEAAVSVVETLDREDRIKLEDISEQVIPQDVPEELFSVLQQARKTRVLFQSHEQRKEALHLIELDKYFQTFDELIQKSSLLVSGDTHIQKHVKLSDPVEEIARELVIGDESLILNKEELVSKKGGFEGLSISASINASSNSGKYLFLFIDGFLN